MYLFIEKYGQIKKNIQFCNIYITFDSYYLLLTIIDVMISILIPTYQFNCLSLIDDLLTQCKQLKEKLAKEFFDFEIIVVDDNSSSAHQQLLSDFFSRNDNCRLILLTENIGSACVRNRLVQEASFPYIIFMDDDAKLASACYIETFWKHRHCAPVVCGSLQTPKECPNKGCELRYYYEQKAYKHHFKLVKKHPYASFTAFNVLVKKEVFSKVSFDLRCKLYGYEDTLFGLMLQQKKIPIVHIDNPLIHTGIDTNTVFLEKTKIALQSLSKLGEPLQSNVGASKTYMRIKQFKLLPILQLFSKIFSSLIIKQILSNKPYLFCFQLYKLFYYTKVMKDKKVINEK